MIHINRRTAPKEFTEFVKKENPQNWSSDFVLRHHDVYDCCRRLLEEDQGGLSAYTELRLDNKPGKKHIDHFRKQALFPGLIFDWYNYVVDNHERDFGSDFKDDQIKTKQANDQLIDPIKEDPVYFFDYQASGEIIPSKSLTNEEDRMRAQFTIDSFNLNHEFLKRKRADLISIIRSYSIGDMSKSDIKDVVIATLGLPSFVEFVLNNILKI